MKIKKLMICLLFLTGLAMVIYPVASQLVIRHKSSNTMEDYKAAMSEISTEKLNTLKEELHQHNSGISENTPVSNTKKAAISNEFFVDDGVIGYVEVPAIDVLLPIYDQDTERNLTKGAAHVPYTSFPIGGKGTHTVITAHSGLSGSNMFKELDKVVIGDTFYLHILDETLAYEVDAINVVDPDNFEYIRIVDGEDYATLLTCTPYGINTFRLLVRGVRVPYSETNENTQNQ